MKTTEVTTCLTCEGMGFVEYSNETGEEVWVQKCPECGVYSGEMEL